MDELGDAPDISDERLHQLEEELQKKEKEVQRARKMVEKRAEIERRREIVRLQQAVSSMEEEVVAEKRETEDLIRAIESLQRELGDGGVNQDHLSAQLLVKQREAGVEEFVRRRLYLKELRKRRNVLDDELIARTAQLEAIEEHSMSHSIGHSDGGRLILRAEEIEREIEIERQRRLMEGGDGSGATNTMDDEEMSIVGARRVDAILQGRIQEHKKEQYKAEKTIHALNEERLAILKRQRKAKEDRMVHKELCSKGVDFLVEYEMGNTPSLEWIIKNIDRETRASDVADDDGNDDDDDDEDGCDGRRRNPHEDKLLTTEDAIRSIDKILRQQENMVQKRRKELATDPKGGIGGQQDTSRIAPIMTKQIKQKDLLPIARSCFDECLNRMFVENLTEEQELDIQRHTSSGGTIRDWCIENGVIFPDLRGEDESSRKDLEAALEMWKWKEQNVEGDVKRLEIAERFAIHQTDLMLEDILKNTVKKSFDQEKRIVRALRDVVANVAFSALRSYVPHSTLPLQCYSSWLDDAEKWSELTSFGEYRLHRVGEKEHNEEDFIETVLCPLDEDLAINVALSDEISAGIDELQEEKPSVCLAQSIQLGKVKKPTCVELSPSCENIAVGTASGQILILHVVNMDKSSKDEVCQTHSIFRIDTKNHAPIHSLEWSLDGMYVHALDAKDTWYRVLLLDSRENIDEIQIPEEEERGMKEVTPVIEVMVNGNDIAPHFPRLKDPQGGAKKGSKKQKEAPLRIVKTTLHPSLSIMWGQFSFMIALSSGMILKMSTMEQRFIVYGRSPVGVGPTISVPRECLRVSGPTEAPVFLWREVFHGHRSSIVLISFMKNPFNFVTVDENFCLFVWNYNAYSYSKAMSWFIPRVKKRFCFERKYWKLTSRWILCRKVPAGVFEEDVAIAGISEDLSDPSERHPPPPPPPEIAWRKTETDQTRTVLLKNGIVYRKRLTGRAEEARMAWTSVQPILMSASKSVDSDEIAFLMFVPYQLPETPGWEIATISLPGIAPSEEKQTLIIPSSILPSDTQILKFIVNKRMLFIHSSYSQDIIVISRQNGMAYKKIPELSSVGHLSTCMWTAMKRDEKHVDEKENQCALVALRQTNGKGSGSNLVDILLPE